ncbi:beta-N-acetylhexosaminidase [Mesorhizobium sp. PAMC28654]|uniref:glycoside hydrolase family 3 protein n=1 Tax=Mesorhizobium sp. PAMC28654 TaxID=2880934 RepID=UPI001D0B11DE|nr:glycoside hydrolase family 3 N-terminal domain-containing protein [Mesorhizobium sp. PAMC28654]UDL91974.1 beta-N-acetylhexosaminidase [Mesorhizobium sp. PAMC28654]
MQPGHVLGDHDKRLLSLLKPAGVVFFRANFLADAPYDDWLATHRKLMVDIREHIGREEVLFCIDHEGGGVLRPPAPITPFAYARRWKEQAADVGRAMGIELASLGFNVNFAPVLDVNSNADNPVIGQRAFGATPSDVTAAARPFLQAMQAEGVLGCPKHFPGHGDTSVDSHYGLPVVDIDAATFRNRELAPFRDMADAEARMIMTAHIVFPHIDPGTPATMSKVMLQDILRGELGFKGVVVSDDLGMAAISSMLDRPETSIKLANAGCDLLCMCAYWADTSLILRMTDHILAGVRDGSVAEATLARSHQRIADLLSSAPRHAVRRLPDDAFARHCTLAPLRDNSPRKVSEGGAATV